MGARTSLIKGWVIVTLTCIHYVISAPCTSTAIPDHHPHTLTKHIPQSQLATQNLQWFSKSLDGSNIVVAQCTLGQDPKCTSLVQTGVYLPQPPTLKDGRYTAQLVIQNVTRSRDQTSWSVSNGDQTLQTCDLEVYSFNSNAVCDDVSVSSHDDTLTWRCVVEGVYPDRLQPRVEYKKKFGSSNYKVMDSFLDIQKEKRVGEHSSPRSVYYDYTITMSLPIPQLQDPSVYQFGFTAIFQHNDTSEPLTKPKVVREFQLTLPTVQLANCPNSGGPQEGFTHPEVVRTCQCQLRDPGVPRGAPQWKDSTGKLLGESTDLVSTLSFSHKSYEQIFTCQGSSSLGTGQVVIFSPKFAYGPTKVAVNVKDTVESTYVDKCDSTMSFDVFCDVADGDVIPKAAMVLSINGGKEIAPQTESTIQGHYRFGFKVTPVDAGSLVLKCLARNAVFGNMTTSASKSLTVRVPPTSTPESSVAKTNQKTISVENGGTVAVSDGDEVKVTCRVGGGLPKVSRVTVTCGSVKEMNDDIEATLTLDLKNGDEDMKCRCEANHVTGCYDKTSEFTFRFGYSASVTSFKVNSISTTLTVVANMNVTFECEARGNPRPEVRVIGQRSKDIVPLQHSFVGAHDRRSVGSKVMTCEDTDVFVCESNNNIAGGDNSKTVSVNVECPPQFQQPSFGQTAKEFLPTAGQQLEIQIPVFGYPIPSIFRLLRIFEVSNTRQKRSVVEEELDEEAYEVNYISGQPPEGVVLLKMLHVTLNSSGQYSLYMSNGIEDGLSFRFYVTFVEGVQEESEDSGLSTNVKIGIGAGVGVLLCILCVLIGMKVQKRRLLRKQEKEENFARRSTVRKHDLEMTRSNVTLIKTRQNDYGVIRGKRSKKSRKKSQSQADPKLCTPKAGNSSGKINDVMNSEIKDEPLYEDIVEMQEKRRTSRSNINEGFDFSVPDRPLRSSLKDNTDKTHEYSVSIVNTDGDYNIYSPSRPQEDDGYFTPLPGGESDGFFYSIPYHHSTPGFSSPQLPQGDTHMTYSHR